MQGLLTAVAEELPDVPLYFSLHDIAHTCKTTPPRAEVMRSAIVNAGTPSHSPQISVSSGDTIHYLRNRANIDFVNFVPSLLKVVVE